MKLNVLKQAYPVESSTAKMLLSAIFFGQFVFLFLFIFQPFGIHDYQHHNKIWHLLGYGGITTMVVFGSYLLCKVFLSGWFNEESWTVGKNILFILWIFLIIGLLNFLYSVELGFLSFNLKGFMIYEGITLLVGVFPVIISTLLIFQNRLKKALNKARELNQSVSAKKNTTDEMIHIPSKNKSEDFKIPLNTLLCIRAVENYIEVCFDENKKVKKHILRNTLKEVENVFENHSQIIKCHRSYLVNLEKISSFSGNAQGLKLHLITPNEVEIPVSRSYVEEIKKRL